MASRMETGAHAPEDFDAVVKAEGPVAAAILAGGVGALALGVLTVLLHSLHVVVSSRIRPLTLLLLVIIVLVIVVELIRVIDHALRAWLEEGPPEGAIV